MFTDIATAFDPTGDCDRVFALAHEAARFARSRQMPLAKFSLLQLPESQATTFRE